MAAVCPLKIELLEVQRPSHAVIYSHQAQTRVTRSTVVIICFNFSTAFIRYREEPCCESDLWYHTQKLSLQGLEMQPCEFLNVERVVGVPGQSDDDKLCDRMRVPRFETLRKLYLGANSSFCLFS